MPKIPDDMEACHQRTLKDRKARQAKRKTEADQRANDEAELRRLQETYPGATVFACRRGR